MTAERLAPFQFRLELPPCQLYSALVMRCVDKNWNKHLLLRSQESIQGLKLHLGMTSRLNCEDTEHAHRCILSHRKHNELVRIVAAADDRHHHPYVSRV
jgi:hypothetical protein